MTDTILFDLDNTILDFNSAERSALLGMIKSLGAEAPEYAVSCYHRINQEQWSLLERGLLSREKLKVQRFALLFEELGLDLPPEKAALTYEQLLGEGCDFVEGARETLEALKGNYRMYAATNGNKNVQKSRIKGAGLDRYFSDFFISEELGADKPSGEFFERCFERIPSFKKECTVMVGDSLSSDIQGGINAGLKTVWLNLSGRERSDPPVPDIEIRRISELPSVLESI